MSAYAEPLTSIQGDAQSLKERIWDYLEAKKIEHKGLKESVNEMLDLIDELADM